MIKPLCDMTESELREYIDNRHRQWHNAEMRVDMYGTFNSIGQANSYRQKYITALKVAQSKGYSLSDEEKEIVKFQY